MLNKIIDNSDLDKYRTSYDEGHVIFVEGDDTQDLYILTSGDVDVFKGNKSMAEITEPGSLFGEMSFLLGAKRTATVKARNQVKAICIPKEEITEIADYLIDILKAEKAGRSSWEPWQDMGIIGHPYHALRLPDGRVYLIYGYRHEPYGIRARILDPECTDFSGEEIVLRDDGGSDRIKDKSIMMPPSQTALPATLWPPPFTATRRLLFLAKLTA